MIETDQPIAGPRFSVIMPTLQRADRIRVAVESVLSQSFADFDLHVVDSGSTDGTLEILESIQDRRLHVWRVPQGSTIAASRNHGISKSRGEWIALLDSDDEWTHDKLEAISAVLRPGCIHYHRLEVQQPNGVRCGEIGTGIDEHRALEFLMLHGNVFPNSSVVFERSAWVELGGLNESIALKGVEDFEFLLRLVQHGWNANFLDRTLGVYWQDGRGITGRLAKMKVHPLREVYRLHLDALPRERRAEGLRHLDRSISFGSIEAIRELGHFGGTLGDVVRSLPNSFAVVRWKDSPRWILAVGVTLFQILQHRGNLAEGRIGDFP